ncbi:ABC transporter ATP-binding protein [Candidatus Saccharibacteria bacterium]|nr:ABC transporter ATP-binding protein [Candidatus Saccharibacteria bacterium]
MSAKETETIIKLKSITKRYGFGDAESFALHNFDLTVKRGEFIMIMGPSGCGKTTLLNVIGLLDKPTSGDYQLQGKSVARISASRKARFRAKEIGFIFQNFNLIPNLTVIDNVCLPLLYSGVRKTRRLKMADTILERFHLREREYYMPHQLSGGQQQRVAIARSLISSPSIILADEPTGNLDSRASHIVMEELRDIHALGNTIIMVTHNPALTTYATRVIHMLDGEIDTDIKTVDDRDLPRPGDPERISVRILPKKDNQIEIAVDAKTNVVVTGNNVITKEPEPTETEKVTEPQKAAEEKPTKPEKKTKKEKKSKLKFGKKKTTIEIKDEEDKK